MRLVRSDIADECQNRDHILRLTLIPLINEDSNMTNTVVFGQCIKDILFGFMRCIASSIPNEIKSIMLSYYYSMREVEPSNFDNTGDFFTVQEKYKALIELNKTNIILAKSDLDYDRVYGNIAITSSFPLLCE